MHNQYRLSKEESAKLERILTRNCYLPNIVSHGSNWVVYDFNGVALVKKYFPEDGTMSLSFIAKDKKDTSLVISEIEEMAEINL